MFADALIKSNVFTTVLDFMDSEYALEARKLNEKIAKIEAGNFFKNGSQERLVIDLSIDVNAAESNQNPYNLLKNVSYLHLKNVDGSEEKLLRFLTIATKLGKSVKTLKLEFDGPDM